MRGMVGFVVVLLLQLAKAQVGRIVVPLYIYPQTTINGVTGELECTDTDWLQIAQDPDCVTAIINPNSGPIEDTNAGMPAYLACVQMLSAAGVDMVGYIPSKTTTEVSPGVFQQTGFKPMPDVLASIDLWLSSALGPMMSGIFVDEVSNRWSAVQDTAWGDHVQFYLDVFAAVRARGLTVYANPGNPAPDTLMSAADGGADVTIIFEGSIESWDPTLTGGTCADGLWTDTQGSFPPGPWCSFVPNWDGVDGVIAAVAAGTLGSDPAVLVYGAAGVGSVVSQAQANGIGTVYITDRPIANPWDVLTSFWDDLAGSACGDLQNSACCTSPFYSSQCASPEYTLGYSFAMGAVYHQPVWVTGLPQPTLTFELDQAASNELVWAYVKAPDVFSNSWFVEGTMASFAVNADFTWQSTNVRVTGSSVTFRARETGCHILAIFIGESDPTGTVWDPLTACPEPGTFPQCCQAPFYSGQCALREAGIDYNSGTGAIAYTGPLLTQAAPSHPTATFALSAPVVSEKLWVLLLAPTVQANSWFVNGEYVNFGVSGDFRWQYAGRVTGRLVNLQPREPGSQIQGIYVGPTHPLHLPWSPSTCNPLPAVTVSSCCSAPFYASGCASRVGLDYQPATGMQLTGSGVFQPGVGPEATFSLDSSVVNQLVWVLVEAVDVFSNSWFVNGERVDFEVTGAGTFRWQPTIGITGESVQFHARESGCKILGIYVGNALTPNYDWDPTSC